MLSIDLNLLTKEQFIELVNYIYKRCDRFSISIPNFQQKGCGDKMKMNKFFRVYMETIKPIYDDIEPHVIYKRITKKYMNSKYSHVMEVKVAKLYKGFKQILLENGCFWNWQYPDMPEDLCFFLGKKCWMLTISHEEVCFIYEETKEDIEMLEKNNILYDKCIDLGDGSAPTYKE